MIAILTEKPSVGMDIARLIGATEKQNGYLRGNGYIVTWAYGHLVGLALPEFYGHQRGTQSLPVIPDPFALTIRQKCVDKKTVTDSTASRQLNVISRVFDQCQSIIVATDAGREGELIFRYIYEHLKCTLPFKRLWISSLTDEAIIEGFNNLQDGSQYNGIYRAADCRAKTDWLIGINASSALAAASGVGNNSLGRVQTPTLAMICSRYLENRDFLPSDYWQLHITLQKSDMTRKFRYIEAINNKQEAESIATRINPDSQALISKVEKKRMQEAPPLLFDLTSLQKECNVHYDLSAEQTLEAAQSLYEKKLISYPRTGSCYISPDIMPQVPSLLRMILRMEQFKHFTGSIDPLRTSTRSVDASKVTDHHALLITGNYHDRLTANEEHIYYLIAGRMLEAFSPPCEKYTVHVEAAYEGMVFHSRSVEILSPGWRGVYNRAEERDSDNEIQPSGIELTEGETLPISSHSLAQCKTRPKPLYTEATLLAAMETAGKNVEDEEARQAMKDSGLGTPATRAAIIETLFRREYLKRSGKSLVPTEKGLYIYNAVKNMRIADVELTGSLEKSLAKIEKGEMLTSTFMKAMAVYTRQVTEELLSLDLKQPEQDTIPCPKCGTGGVAIHYKVAKCGNQECRLTIYPKFLNKELTEQHIRQLLSSGKTKLIKGFKGKQGKSFDAYLTFDRDFNITFSFPDKKGGSPGKTKPNFGNSGSKLQKK